MASRDDLRLALVPTNRIEQIIHAIALPHESEPIRYRDSATSQKSAVAKLTQEISINWSTAVTDKAIPAADAMAFIFRNPLRNIVYYDNNSGALTWTYQWRQQTDSVNFDINARSQTIEMKPRRAEGTSAYLPHGANLYPGFDEDGYYMWCDRFAPGTGAVTVTLNAAPAVGESVGVTMWQWDGKNGVFVNGGAITNPGTTLSLDAPNRGGYIRLQITNNTTTASTCTIIQSGNSGVWCHLPAAEIDDMLLLIEGQRILADAALWSNRSSDLNEAGRIISCTLFNGRPWQSVATGANGLASLRNFKTRNAKDGYYGFLKPENQDDFQYHDNITQSAIVATPTLWQAAYPLRERSPYKAIAWTVAATAARDTSLNVCVHLEYLTNTMIVNQTTAEALPQEWEAAALVCATMDTDYNNDIHISDILGTIGTYGPTVLTTAEDILKELPVTPYTAPVLHYLEKFKPAAMKLFEKMKGKKRKNS